MMNVTNGMKYKFKEIVWQWVEWVLRRTGLSMQEMVVFIIIGTNVFKINNFRLKKMFELLKDHLGKNSLFNERMSLTTNFQYPLKVVSKLTFKLINKSIKVWTNLEQI